MAPKAMKEGTGSLITGNRTSRKESTTMKIGKISHTYMYKKKDNY